MNYKNEVHEKLEHNLAKKLVDVPKFISDYLITLRSSRTKLNNWGIIRDMLEYFIKTGKIGKNTLQEITPEDMQGIVYTDIIAYLNSKKSWKDSSILVKKAVIAGFWNYLYIGKYVTENIVHLIPKETFKNEETEKEVKIPTDEQLDRFFQNLRQGNNNEFNCIRNITIVKLFIGSGIRCEELMGLDMQDLHLDAEKPYISILGKGKNKVQDDVFVSYEAAEYMREYLEHREIFIEEKSESGKSVDDVPVFLSNSCHRMSKTAIRNFFERYSDNEIYPHMLRHLCGTRLYKATKDIKLVQRQLRHKDVKTASKYYIHTSDDELQNAVSQL